MSHADADSTQSARALNACVVVAGGSGLRFGARKQFADLAGRSVLQRSVDAASTVAATIVVVVPSDAIEDDLVEGNSNSHVVVVTGGETRAASVRAGLAAVPDAARFILVHDAARPLASEALFRRVIGALVDGALAVVPAVSVADTIRRRTGGIVDRDELCAVQTPQGFDAETLREAHAAGGEATDDATLVEARGIDVILVDGEPQNRKLTEPTDLVTATALVRTLEEKP